MGPCLCGDPYCSSCGNPYAAALEAAEEWMMEEVGKANLNAEEYKIVVAVGLAAVTASREYAKTLNPVDILGDHVEEGVF